MTRKSDFYEVQGYGVGLGDYDNDDRLCKVRNIIEQHICGRDKTSIVDIGCGDAKYLMYLKERLKGNIKLSGCDVSEYAIKRNRERAELKDIVFYTANLNNRDVFRDSYDVMIASEVIEHLENTDNFFIECHNALNYGGILIVTTPNLASWLDRIMLLFGMQPFSTEVSYKSRVFGRKALYKIAGISDSQAVGHLRLFTPAALKDLARYHKFVLQEHCGFFNQKHFINKYISRINKNLAEGMIMVFLKEKT